MLSAWGSRNFTIVGNGNFGQAPNGFSHWLLIPIALTTTHVSPRSNRKASVPSLGQRHDAGSDFASRVNPLNGRKSPSSGCVRAVLVWSVIIGRGRVPRCGCVSSCCPKRAREQVWALPRSLLGVLGIPLQIGQISAKRFDSIFREYDRLALDGRRAPDPSAGRKLTRGGWSRLQRIREDLLSQLGEAQMVEGLITLIGSGDDVTLAKMRPYALGDQGGFERRRILELFLLGTRKGLPEFSMALALPDLPRQEEQGVTPFGD